MDMLSVRCLRHTQEMAELRKIQTKGVNLGVRDMDLGETRKGVNTEKRMRWGREPGCTPTPRGQGMMASFFFFSFFQIEQEGPSRRWAVEKICCHRGQMPRGIEEEQGTDVPVLGTG